MVIKSIDPGRPFLLSYILLFHYLYMGGKGSLFSALAAIIHYSAKFALKPSTIGG